MLPRRDISWPIAKRSLERGVHTEDIRPGGSLPLHQGYSLTVIFCLPPSLQSTQKTIIPRISTPDRLLPVTLFAHVEITLIPICSNPISGRHSRLEHRDIELVAFKCIAIVGSLLVLAAYLLPGKLVGLPYYWLIATRNGHTRQDNVCTFNPLRP